MTDLAVMPHLLIAGSTGTGKSVALNALIASLLYKATPEEVKIVLIDPKRLEFTLFEDIPHLLCPVINDPKKAHVVLNGHRQEDGGALQEAPGRQGPQHRPVQHPDEAAHRREEGAAHGRGEAAAPAPALHRHHHRRAGRADDGRGPGGRVPDRPAGPAGPGRRHPPGHGHPAAVDRRHHRHDQEQLRLPHRLPRPVQGRLAGHHRHHPAPTSSWAWATCSSCRPTTPASSAITAPSSPSAEIKRLVKHVKSQGTPTYDTRILHVVKGDADPAASGDGEKDELYDKAVETVLQSGQASASHLQRRLELGYARAARIIDQMEDAGLIGPKDGSKPREILIDRKEFFKEQMRKRAGGAGQGPGGLSRMVKQNKTACPEDAVLQYRPVISFRVRKALGSSNPDWEDVVNEILTQAVAKIKSGEFRGDSSIGTFLYTITSRRIIDYIRQKTRVLKHAPEPVPYPDPHDEMEHRERAKQVEQVVAGLKPKFRDVLYLYYYKELSREEVARTLDISPRRVSERVNYALKLIQKAVRK
ncbi:MAG: sigma-70 family RNA polymerase sigma factor [Desulfobacterales bacterium]|nr:sigma-70 family RNA polymerase sigma factor [Desulfobacterales bacterium]